MSTTKHTPGPWLTYRETPNDEWLLIVAGRPSGPIVANINAKSCPDIYSAPCFRVMPQEANARLIAAAPEMLDLLKKCLTWAERYAKTNDIDISTGSGPLSQDCRAARELIAKLEGKR